MSAKNHRQNVAEREVERQIGDAMFLKLYCIALPIFFAADMIWLGVAAKNFYAKQIGFLMKANVNWAAAILFYLLFLAGLVVFVIAPAVDKGSWARALLFGALFGLITYATYDLTNLATLKDWPLVLTVVDLTWGMVLAGSVSVATYLIASQDRPMNYYTPLAFLLWAYVSLWFLISLFKRRNDVADVAWGLGFVLLAWTSFFLSGGSGTRGLLVGILVSVWGVRLAWHIHARHRGKAEDFRYMAWRREWGRWFYARSYAQVYLLQGALLFLVALPVLMINRSTGGHVRFSQRHRRLCLAVWIPFRIGGGCRTCAVRKRSAQSGQDTAKRAVAVHPTPQLFRRGRAVVGHLAGGGRCSGRLVWHCRAPHHHPPDPEGFRDSNA